MPFSTFHTTEPLMSLEDLCKIDPIVFYQTLLPLSMNERSHHNLMDSVYFIEKTTESAKDLPLTFLMLQRLSQWMKLAPTLVSLYTHKAFIQERIEHRFRRYAAGADHLDLSELLDDFLSAALLGLTSENREKAEVLWMQAHENEPLWENPQYPSAFIVGDFN